MNKRRIELSLKLYDDTTLKFNVQTDFYEVGAGFNHRIAKQLFPEMENMLDKQLDSINAWEQNQVCCK